ncbi:hypothetical protein QR685DRAFT_568998 [Neurospora intermedia]|uniref:Uncharacterized protein n=1 Tax=Neurospora intermedia TaxID=5142 RepID=A0ABR3DJI2_NEUIN
MSFFNQTFIAHSARAVHPQPPSSFNFGNSSDFLQEQWLNACFGETYTNVELDAGNGLVLNPSQVDPRKTSVNTTSPLKTTPRSTSPYHTSSPHTSPYGTSARHTPSTGTASVARSPYTSSSQGTSPYSISPYMNSPDIGHLKGKDDLRRDHVASLDGNIAMSQHTGGFANGIPAYNHPHNYHLARPGEKIGTYRTCHKAISNPRTDGISIVAATNGSPPLNVDLSHASGHINHFESCRKPCPVHGYSNTHLTQTNGQMKQSGAGGFLNDNGHGFNFHLGNLPSYPDQSMSRHPGTGHDNLGYGVGVHDGHRNNRELRNLAEFQKWVLGLDTSTAGFPLDLGFQLDLEFKSNSSNHGRMKSTEGQGMSTTALTSTPLPFTSPSHGIPRNRNDPASGGYSHNMQPTFSPNCNNYKISKKGSPRHPELPPKATLHNSLPFPPTKMVMWSNASLWSSNPVLENVLTIWKTRSYAIVVPSLSGATPVASTSVRAAVPRPGRGWKEEACCCRCW